MFDHDVGGGFINAVAYAADSWEFLALLSRSLGEYGVALREVLSAMLLSDYLRARTIEPKLSSEIAVLEDQEVRYGVLHTYPREELS